MMLFSQKKVTNQQLIWYTYNNTIRFNDNWALVSEVQERQFFNPTAQHQLVFRSNIQRKLIENWIASAGMTYFLQSPQDPESESNLTVPELRPDLGFENKQRLSFMTISHRYKAEARFIHDFANDELTGGYRFSSFRFRYQLGFDIPVWRNKDTREERLSLKIKEEILLNAGSKIVKNTFDQNRIYAGINYRINPAFSVEAGYLNWYQQRVSGTEYYDRDIIRFSLFHTLFLKTKKS
ncbi:DUF2490 domain-containing protein [Flavobacterium cerinum]|uniref:DUF2490 domain-containing protein n=1 Tax=Flavobacterium cerinum TaxID=2502784 RepID=A0ABY5IN36_9FLAO|nr:DUF2490 domain-containing protein [Flavobacterium cerinum]UUC44247.1 DUF2490 domain-containing protein [Flavobacterium cerinum]